MPQLSKTSHRFIRRSAMVAIVALAFGNAQAAYISDGDFETPLTDSYVYRPSAATGVTFTNDAGIATDGYFYGPDTTEQYGFIQNTGDQSPGSNGGPGAITFAVTTLNLGSIYDVDFTAAQRSVNTAFMVLFDGVSIGTFTPTATDTFQSFSTSFTAAGSSGSLEFLGIFGTNATAFDHVVVTAREGAPTGPGNGTVPEPAPLALLSLGVFGGLFARRRSATPQV